MEIVYPDGATPLDPDEMEGLKFAHIETRGELDQLEQQNIQEGFNWLARQRNYNDFLTEAFLLELHKRLFGLVWTWAGRFRQSEKNIGVDYLMIGIELRNLLDDARFWLENATYGREEFAARFHHRLVKIHPFPNGNGRHARIMTDEILKSMLHVEPINWAAKPLGTDGEHRETYIHALRAADTNDYSALIAFVSD